MKSAPASKAEKVGALLVLGAVLVCASSFAVASAVTWAFGLMGCDGLVVFFLGFCLALAISSILTIGMMVRIYDRWCARDNSQ